MPVILDVADLQKNFGSYQAVKGITFSVPEGQTYALLGGNGAGKTTTLTMILGLLTPSAGHIRIFDKNMPKERVEIAQGINFSSPYVDLPYRMTVQEILKIYMFMYDIRNTKERTEELVSLLKLENIYKKLYGDLSAGQKTRVSIAKALINNPKLLLLDEPTASLDPDTADWVRGIFEIYQKEHGTTILLASHNMPEVERLAHQVLMMQEGMIVDRGAPEALIKKYGRQNMEEVFLHIVRQGIMEDAV